MVKKEKDGSCPEGSYLHGKTNRCRKGSPHKETTGEFRVRKAQYQKKVRDDASGILAKFVRLPKKLLGM